MDGDNVLPRPDMSVRLESALLPAGAIFAIVYCFGAVLTICPDAGPLFFLGRLGGMLLHRGVVPWMTVAAFAMALALAWKKHVAIRRQEAFLRELTLPQRISLSDYDSVNGYIKRVKAAAGFEANMVAVRVVRLLQVWLTAGIPERVASTAVEESRFDRSIQDASQRLPIGLLAAIPILGFIGTLVGIYSAIAGFTFVMEAADDVSGIKEGMQVVTRGLTEAFDTSFLAVFLVVPALIAYVWVRAREDAVLRALDMFVQDRLIASLPGSKSGEAAVPIKS
ncbi:MAG: MotA/TolQ/ExbB proton channel family protein [Kiritimatiellae bacterium]|nr:MotA/TolQ/ExbB proton channel family protein [Kiritimatiellia bacterium]